ncbi:hypothetical protein SSCG_00941 [Streptomyces clavuligerus]|nr:hypothetical protein SSCG_00941 [Streptomyces clavuligerus]
MQLALTGGKSQGQVRLKMICCRSGRPYGGAMTGHFGRSAPGQRPSPARTPATT